MPSVKNPSKNVGVIYGKIIHSSAIFIRRFALKSFHKKC